MAFDHISIPKGGRVSQPIRPIDLERIRGLEREIASLRADQAKGWTNTLGELFVVHQGWGKFRVIRGVVEAEGLTKEEAEALASE